MMSTGTVQRNRPGTRAQELFAWPEQPLDEVDGSFAVQQHIQAILRKHPADVDKALELPESQEEESWQHEHFRQILQDLNLLAVKLLPPVCSAATCPVMKATVDDQQQYLCATHKQPQECCAIDYILHLLDNSASTLNSSKLFPSRVTFLPGSSKQYQPLARRLYRIFAHAYHQHREQFDEFEEEHRLLERFLKFCRKFDLLSDATLIPVEYC